jgi:hypothetical protein
MLAAEASPSTLDFVTLGVAIFGVSLAALSLSWQAATFFLSGSRIRVRIRHGAVRGDQTRVSFPINASESDVAYLRKQGYTKDVAVAEVRNRGRLAISVESVSIKTHDKYGFAVLEDPENPALPFRLEPGAMQTWHVPIEPVQALANMDGRPRRIGMVVEFGSGKVIETKKSIVVDPSPGQGASK